MGTAQTSASVALTAVHTAEVVANIAAQVAPFIQFAAGFIPGAAPIVQIVTAAIPWAAKVAQYAPVAASFIEKGEPIFAAIDKASPDLFAAFKNLTALSSGKDVDAVTDAEVFNFAGPAIIGRKWTDNETQQWWDRAQGQA